MISLTLLTKPQMASLFLSEKSFMESGFLRPTALAFFSHGLNFLEVFRPTLGGCFSATATEGDGGGVFLCHAARLQKPLAVCQIKARESAKYGETLRLAFSNSDMAAFDTNYSVFGCGRRNGQNVD